ncbi:hypothetical protein McanCB56680_006965 [Microsporum canis]
MPSTELESWKSHFPAGDLWVFGYGFESDMETTATLRYTVIAVILDNPLTSILRGRVLLMALQIKELPGTSRAMFVDSGSTDHRGTPDAPGRVVTVIERSFWESLSDPQRDLEQTTEGSLVWGAAYHIPASHAEEVSAYLDDREIDGYSVHYTPFHPCSKNEVHINSSPRGPTAESTTSPQPMKCLVYIGLPTNTQFLREPALREPDAVAKVIYASRGQSGENKDYLYSLETALEGLGLGSSDVHVTDLVRRVKDMERG